MLSESFSAKVALERALAMKKSKFTEQQIAFALQQAEGGTTVEDICRKLGICQATFFRWKKMYGGLMPSEVRKLRSLEEENRPPSQVDCRSDARQRDVERRLKKKI